VHKPVSVSLELTEDEAVTLAGVLEYVLNLKSSSLRGATRIEVASISDKIAEAQLQLEEVWDCEPRTPSQS
jgi:hypothetical protein